MAIQYFNETKWASLVSMAVQEQSIAARICTGQYQMEGAKIIKAPNLAAISTQTYTPGTALTPTAMTDTDFSITINQYESVLFTYDDTTKMFGQDLSASQIALGAGSLAIRADIYALSLVNAGTSGISGKLGTLAVPISITSANVITNILALGQMMDEDNLSKDRFLVVPYFVIYKLLIKGLGIQLADTSKDPIWKDADIIRFGGFNIIGSNSVKKDATADGFQALAFTSDALPLVGNTVSFEKIRTAGLFADNYQALYAFGASARVNKIAVLSCTEGAEA